MPNISTVRAVINGTTYNLTYDSATGKYTAQGVAPAASSSIQTGGYYPVSVTAEYNTGTSTTVNDQTAGAIGTGCRFVVKEKTAPKALFQYPTNGSRITNVAGQYITLRLSDHENGQASGYSGVKLSTFWCKIDGTTTLQASDFTQTAIMDGDRIAGYTMYYNAASAPLADGTHVITAYTEDVDGNASEVASVTVTVDTVAPSLTVSAPTEGFATASATVNVTGVTSDETSTPVTVEIYLNGVLDGTAEVVQGAFSYPLTFTSEGNQEIKVKSSDTAGLYTEVTVNGYYSTATPVISAVELDPNPADGGATYIIRVTVA